MAAPMTDPEFQRLMRAITERWRVTTDRDRSIFFLLGRTGLRRCELLELKVRDVRFEGKPPFLWVSTLKLRKPVRDTVLLERALIRVLSRWIEWGFNDYAGRQPLEDDPLFPVRNDQADGRDGDGFKTPPEVRKMSPRNLTKLFRFYAGRAKLPAEMSLHSLRHYRGTELYHKTKDLEFTRRELRHSRLSSTAVYLHTDPDRARAYLKKLEERS